MISMVKDKFIEGCQNVDITKSPHGELTIKFLEYLKERQEEFKLIHRPIKGTKFKIILTSSKSFIDKIE